MSLLNLVLTCLTRALVPSGKRGGRIGRVGDRGGVGRRGIEGRGREDRKSRERGGWGRMEMGEIE